MEFGVLHSWREKRSWRGLLCRNLGRGVLISGASCCVFRRGRGSGYTVSQILPPEKHKEVWKNLQQQEQKPLQ